jgi:serine/threonine-protein kinase PpkA
MMLMPTATRPQAVREVPARDRFAGYTLEGVLGHGRDATVYLAFDEHHDRHVALKVASRNLGDEFRVQALLSNRHAIEVYECGTQDGEGFLAMEFAPGGSVMRPGVAVEPGRVAQLFMQAAQALTALHWQGWVHRDLKPAHLLLRADGRVALADFGCARRPGEGAPQAPGIVIGTPRYAAPEQSEGAAADARADVYSLGACLYEMLSGKPPYPGETVTELLGQHQMAPVPRLPKGQASWQPLLEDLLAKDPSRRPADGAAVLERLQSMEHDTGESH